MKILQIGFTDLMGKRFNGTSLHQELLSLGIYSQQCLWNKNTNDPHTWLMSPQHSRIFKNILKNLEYSLGVQSILYPYSWRLFFDRRFRKTDLVHYHIIYPNFFSLLSLPFLTHLKPTVWTLHDPWSLTGHCIHPFSCRRWKIGCGLCPNLKTPLIMSKDNTALMWKIKKFIYHNSKFDLIVGSEWMFKFAKKSPLISQHRIHYIPFGINLNIFKPSSIAQAKKEMGVFPPKNIVIGFRASFNDFKGFQFIKEALHKLNLRQRISLLSFDDRGLLDEFRTKFQIIDLGWIDNEKLLAKAYNACDLFLMPSVAEAFGLMAVEVMACAKPVVVFSKTALAKTVFAPKGGIAVDYKDSNALAATITNLISDSIKRKKIGLSARRIAEENYNFTDYVRRHITLYKEVIKRAKN
ncbi:MAG: glycosyltransferase [Actinobacteria bacterium]|nr:glycosyltransferase [Actinomycetota bacterium]